MGNSILLAGVQMRPLMVIVEEGCWQWLGHVFQVTDSSLPGIVLGWTLQGKEVGVDQERRGEEQERGC